MAEDLTGFDEAQKLAEAQRQELQTKIAATEKDVAAEKSSRERFASERPVRESLPKTPTISPFKSTPFVVASSALLMASIAGPVFARQGSTAAMNSLSAALQGLHEGNKERYTAEMASYKNHIDTMDRRYEEALQRHDRIMKQHDKSIQEKLTELNLFYKQLYGSEHKTINILTDAEKERSKTKRLSENNKTKTDIAEKKAKKGGSPFAQAPTPESEAKPNLWQRAGKWFGKTPKTFAEAYEAFKESNPEASDKAIRAAIAKNYPTLKE